MFRFDFNVETDTEAGKIFSDDKPEFISKISEQDTGECYDCKEILPTDDIFQDIELYRVNSTSISAGEVTLCHIKSGNLLQLFDGDTIKDITKAEQDHSDLIPGVYEGGAKIWECTYDLLHYLAEYYPPHKLRDLRVLDLGCGSGILGIYAFMCGAVVHFQDYNQDVLEKITIPNVLVNVSSLDDINLKRVKFYSGDWSKFKETTKDEEQFDVILTSETIYNPDSQQNVLDTIKSKLKIDGVTLLGAKVHYFGVGGGLRQFEELIKKDIELKSRSLWASKCGVCREIIEIKINKNCLE